MAAAFAVSVSGENLLVLVACCISKTSCYNLGLACNVLKFLVFCYIALHFHLVFVLVIKLQIFPFHSLILAFLFVLIPSLMCLFFFSHSQS